LKSPMSKETDLTEIFKNAGYDKKTIENLLKNKSLAQTVAQLFIDSEAKDISQVSYLLFTLASKCKSETHRILISKYVGSLKIKTSFQLEEAMAYVRELTKETIIDMKEFEEKCGVGIKVTPDEMKNATKKVLTDFIENKKNLLNVGDIIVAIKKN